MVGTVDVGPQNFDVSVKQIKTFDVDVLDDAERAFAIPVDTEVITVVLEAPTHTVTYEEAVVEALLLDPVYELTAVVASTTLNDYDRLILDLYGYYGTAAAGQAVLYGLDELVRIELYEAGNGITNE